jgi:hypothetical protein
MSPAKPIFDSGLGYARSIRGVYLAARSLILGIDLSDLLRAQIVSAVSAFDYYIHELVRFGMLEINAGTRPPTPGYHRFTIPLRAVANSATNPLWLDSEIREKHGYLAFQLPDKVADAIRNISEKTLWRELSTSLGIPDDKIKERLRLIVQRRNKIVHEADIDPTTGLRWGILETDVDATIDFLERVAHAIDAKIW